MEELIGKFLVCDNKQLDEETGLCVGYYYDNNIAYVIIKLSETAVAHYKSKDIVAVRNNPHTK